jgi:putative hydrolase
MIEVDLHSHSLFSHCGLHTFIEMLQRAKELGMKALAITDHGPALKGRLTSVFFQRLVDPVPGIRLLKGVECNLLDEPGLIDSPVEYLSYMDIVQLGFHPNTPLGLGVKTYTEMLIRAMEKNQYIDIITHPNSQEYEVDFREVIKAALEFDMAIEINNSKRMLGVVSLERTQELIYDCKKLKCPVVISSDAHAIREIGLDDSVRPLLMEAKFPRTLIMNRDSASAFSYLEKRKKRREKLIAEL